MLVDPFLYSKPYAYLESGIREGMRCTINSGDETLLDIAEGKLIFSEYNLREGNQISYNGGTITPGQSSQDLSLVYPSWPALTGSETVLFILIDKNGDIYQTGLSPLTGDVVRKYLTLCAVQIDNTTDRNITFIYPVINYNAADYEESNIRTPTFVGSSDLNVYGNSAATTFGRNLGGIYFSGVNIWESTSNPNIKDYTAESTLTFSTVFQDGSGGYNFITGLTDFSDYVGVYHDGTPSGVPLPDVVITNPKFTVHYLFFEASLGFSIFQIGTRIYNSIQDAIDAINNGTENINVAPFLRGLKDHYHVIMKGDASDFSDATQVTFIKPTGRFFNRV